MHMIKPCLPSINELIELEVTFGSFGSENY